MNRCETRRPPHAVALALPFSRLTARAATLWLATACLAVGLGLASRPAHAQSDADAAQATTRTFPQNAVRATMLVTSPPDITLDGRAARLSPGARIRGADNAFVMSGAILGVPLVVNFTRESNGLVHDVWILTEAEIAQKTTLLTQPRNFLFGSETAPRAYDDGKTPYNQLPGYGSK